MIGGDACQIVIVPLDVGPDAVCAAAGLLSRDERCRADRFVRARDRRRFVVARARLRQLLAERLEVPADRIELTYGPWGKPRLAPLQRQADVRFNVSHCDGVAAFAFTEGRDIGIDIEAVRPLPDADLVAALAFSPRENQVYRQLAPHDKPLGFFNCWTRKEALVKAIGDGFQFPLASFDVSLAPGEPARLLRLAGTGGSRSTWTLQEFVPHPGFVGAVAVGTPAPLRHAESEGARVGAPSRHPGGERVHAYAGA